MLEQPVHPPPQQHATSDETRGISFELMTPAADLPSSNSVPMTPPAVPEATKQDKVSQSSFYYQNSSTPGEAHIIDVPADPESAHVPDPAPPLSHENVHDPSSDASSQIFARRPSTTPILVSEYRFCNKDKIIKPPRTHHCRACGTVSKTTHFTTMCSHVLRC